MPVIFEPIGVVRTRASDAELKEKRRVEGELEIFSQFEPALEGIEGYSHLFVIVYLDRLRPEQIGPLKVKPRGLLKRGFTLDDLPSLGVFALDSPTRPNPIGLTLVRFHHRENNRLIVSGLDFFDGTPILDLKPYQPQYHEGQYDVPEWFRKLVGEAGDV